MSVAPPLPSSDYLTIGSVTLLDEEHPDDLSFELNQVLSVHINVGGSRTIQELGPNPSDVQWRGRLFAGNVKDRLAALKALEVAAAPVPLTYLDQAYSVIVRKFTSKYFHRWRGAYDITVAVLADQSGQYTTTPTPSTNGQVDGLSAAAQATLDQMADEDAVGTYAIQQAFNALFLQLEEVGVLSQLTGLDLQGLLSTADAATAAAQAYASTLGSNGSSSQFLLATQLVSYGTLIARNIQQGQAPAVIVKQGGDLFDVAAAVYGDPSLAFALASANGLVSPMLSNTEIYQLVLPALQAS